MKETKFFNLLVPAILLTLVVTGCPKHPQGSVNIPPAEVPNPELAAGLTNANETGGSGSNLVSYPLANPDRFTNYIPNDTIFKDYTVHFAFDSSAVRSAEKSKVTYVADYLKSNPMDLVRVEGHCDERGTAEYNRSLGERRALALREELIRLGIEANNIDTATYGFDRPVDPGHDETAWAKNRRGEFILLTPPPK